MKIKAICAGAFLILTPLPFLKDGLYIMQVNISGGMTYGL